jgi:hypothetical protein
VHDKTLLAFQEQGQVSMAQFVTLALGFSAGKTIASETMEVQVLKVMTRLECFLGIS